MKLDRTGNVIPIFGGPGCGKSTLAANLYVELKRQHIDVDNINEYPKEMVYQDNMVALSDQIYIFANQYHRLWTAAAHNNLVITDSPILLSAIYNPDTSHHFKNLILEMHNKFHNLNIVLKRTPETHTMVGRIHTLTESISIDNRIRDMLREAGQEYLEFDPINDSIISLVKLIKQEFEL